LYALKSESKIELDERDFSDPFKEWKNDLTEKNIIALIPFVRNLVEYGKNKQKDFILLTHLLHKKNELKYFKNGKVVTSTKEDQYDEVNGDFSVLKTEEITFSHLKTIYKEYLGIECFNSDIDENSKIYEKIISIADCINDQSLESKIALAIAIRFEAEKFMIKKIETVSNVDKIDKNQTIELFDKLKGNIKASKIDKVDDDILKVLDSVNIITPENIHINSFMYEPILDMGIDELKKLYKKVKNLH
jgi:hypothetical protein